MRDGSGSSELPVEIQRPRGGGGFGETWIYNGQHPLLARSKQALRQAPLATSKD